MKNFKSILGFLFLSLQIPNAYAVDENPVIKSVQNEEETRFFLIGVISEGQGANSKKGIAVIRDSQTGKSITLKVGEKLLSGSEITLSMVERSKATLSNGSKSWMITYDQASATKEAASEFEESNTYAFGGADSDGLEDEFDDEGIVVGARDGSDPGLFERWYASLKLKENQAQEIKISPNGELYQSRINTDVEAVKPVRAQVER